MLKVALKEEMDIKKQKAVSRLNENTVVQEMKLLIDSDGIEDMRILRGLGTQHSAIKAQDAYGVQLSLEKLSNTYAGEIYTTDQIKTLAIKYALKFLPTKVYKGNLDIQVVSKIKEFAAKTNTPIEAHSLSTRFFILAPAENFMITKKEEIVIIDRDPLLFYKIDEDHWRFLYKWGNDFSILRLIKGFRLKNRTNYSLVTFLTTLSIVMLIAGFLFPTFFAFYPKSFVFLFGLIAFGAAMLFIDWTVPVDKNDNSDMFYENGWNKHEEISVTYR